MSDVDEDLEDVDGFERATVRDLRARVDDLEERVEELEDLCRMAAERLREQREQNDQEDAPDL